MANKLYEENDIQAIANAIRGKNGSTDTYMVSEMATAINDIPSGGNLEDFIPEEAFHISGQCMYIFANNHLDWFLEKYGDKITTSDISNASSMFRGSILEQIPFDINFADGGGNSSNMFAYAEKLKSIPSIDFKQTSIYDCSYLFQHNHSVTEIGKLYNMYPSSMQGMFNNCERLRYLPEIENLNLSGMQASATANFSSMFSRCYSLRKIPEKLLEQLYSRVITKNSNTQFYDMYRSCDVLDEIVGMSPISGTLTSNAFSSYSFYFNARAKNIMFKVPEDGTLCIAEWKNQTIDLSQSVGWYNGRASNISFYNSGITGDKEVTDDSSYQALKNDPDWFTIDVNYSRYNHDSAVNTINSLPDTSTYLASAGGTNTIKFKGESGKLTDGGAINTLTEAEIAVATAKGWTVTFA